MKKTAIKALTGLSLVAAGCLPALASCGSSKVEKKAHIISISDIHGEIPGYGDDFFKARKTYAGAIRTADAMQEIVQNASDSIILSGGDQNSSGPFSSCLQGETMYPVMKQMDIRYSAVGNHAWDWGKANLTDKVYDKWGRTDKTQGSYFISSNIMDFPGWSDRKWTTDEKDDNFQMDFNSWYARLPEWLEPYKVITLDGHKICLIGLTTKTTLEDGNKRYTEELSFIDYNAAVHYSKHLLKLRDPQTFNQIDSYILLTHCGGVEEGGFIKGDIGQIAQTIDTPIDAILGGHTHTDIVGKVYNNVIDRLITITETSDKMQSFADLELTFDDSKPTGKKLTNINAKIIKPKIETSSFEAAKKQLDDIIANPRNEVVKKVCEEYATQKQKAITKLKTKIGEATNTMDYLQSEHNNLYDYKYPLDYPDEPGKSDSLVELAGAFAAKSEIAGFNIMCDKMTPEEKAEQNPACISYISNTSIHDGFKAGDLTMNDIYGLFPYDEYTVTATLTYYQLKQIIHYMFGGAKLTKDERISKVLCDEQYKAEPTAEPYYPLNHRYPYGPNQFYGFCFNATAAKSDDAQHRRYIDRTTSTTAEEDPLDLRVYDPEKSSCNIDDPTTWEGESYWWDKQTNQPKKYITIVMSSFDMFETNRQNLMIPYFTKYNQTKHVDQPKFKIKEYITVDVRDLCLEYVKNAGSVYMPESIVTQLINLYK